MEMQNTWRTLNETVETPESRSCLLLPICAAALRSLHVVTVETLCLPVRRDCRRAGPGVGRVAMRRVLCGPGCAGFSVPVWHRMAWWSVLTDRVKPLKRLEIMVF